MGGQEIGQEKLIEMAMAASSMRSSWGGLCSMNMMQMPVTALRGPAQVATSLYQSVETSEPLGVDCPEPSSGR
jgi:hypothetical protein